MSQPYPFIPNSPSKITTRPVSLDDYVTVEDMVYRAAYSYRHLDWRNPQDWVGDQPFYIAEDDTNPVGVLACPSDIPNLTWLRYFGCTEYAWLHTAWRTLLNAAVSDLARSNISQLFSIAFADWYSALLINSGFHLVQRIVVLEWKPKENTIPLIEREISLRRMEESDLQSAFEIDRSAFAPQWGNTLETLTLAFHQSAYATMAEVDGKIVGYSISTSYPQSAHLARIAVDPHYQGIGIGKSLLIDMLSEFTTHGAEYITVNTQDDNHHSLQLYRRMGFHLTGEDYPIFRLEVNR